MERIINNDWIFYRSREEFKGHLGGRRVHLPHTWNAEDGQDGGNDYYRGGCWYEKTLEDLHPKMGTEWYLQFDGVAMDAEVYLNNEKLCVHHGGYSTFRVNITDRIIEGNNELVVSVSNSPSHTYPQNADFTFYGGIYRDVRLLCVPDAHFALDYYGGVGLRVTPTVTDLEDKTAEVTVEAWVKGKAESVRFSVSDADGATLYTMDASVNNGYAEAKIPMPSAHLWDGVFDPYLYRATASLANGETVSLRFGYREFHVDPQRGFFLNGRSYPLRGVSRHQDWAGVGNALTSDMHKEDVALIREIGANTVRLAHYQHSQEFYDLCDEAGLIVWAEIPYITMHMSSGRENTLSQMKELIVQCSSHPSIVCWGLSNEITVASTVNEALLENHRALNDLCHRMDPSRLTTMASAFMLEIESPILEIPDINSYNLYFGWYLNELDDNEKFFDAYHERFPERCIGFSEYGADANIRFHSSRPEKGDYTEEYQCLYHEHILEMLESRPWIWSSHVWNMFDFAADGRDEGGAHGLNQKGLVSFDRKTKKDAFYLYKAWWGNESFVHICGSRYVYRTEDVTEVKVYSNEEEVSLYVDGTLLETQQGRRIFRFRVPLRGRHEIIAKTACCEDHIILEKVAEPNASYTLVKQPEVVNWFDQDKHNPSRFSIFDTVGEITQNPDANAIYLRMKEKMDAAVAARGDIAQSATANPALQKMINRQTFRNLIRLCGVSLTDEELRELNYSLQQIEKEGNA